METLEKYLEKKYVLKLGHLLYYNDIHYNNEALTDEIAESAIKKLPALANNFITERERKLIETRIEARLSIKLAEDRVMDEALEKEISELIKAGNFKKAGERIEKLNVRETKEKFLKEISGNSKK